jgi:hypothetical protein
MSFGTITKTNSVDATPLVLSQTFAKQASPV